MPKDDLARQGPIMPAFHTIAPGGLSPDGAAIIAANTPLTSRFVEAQRERVRLGGLDQFRQTFKMVDMDVEYSSCFGQERITLTPRPRGVPEPVLVEPELPVYPPPDIDEFPVPTVETPTLCMLVLYKTAKGVCAYAAIPMSQLTSLTQPPNFNPIYSATDKSADFTQPVKTGQYNFAGFNFIMTDVDLSGKGLKKSTICTTRMIDAITLGQQALPIVNSPSAQGGKPDINQQIQLYTPFVGVLYSRGKFLTNANNVNTQQCQAITSSGKLYYGSTFDNDGPNVATGLVLLQTDGSTLDTDAVQPEIAKADYQSSNYVPFYNLGYTDIHKQTGKYSYDASFSTAQYPLPTPTPIFYSVTLSTKKSVSMTTDNEVLTVVSLVIPSDNSQTLPPDEAKATQNLNNITEINGTSYYGVSTYGQTMTYPNIKQAHCDVPYYEWVQSDLFYEYEIPETRLQVDYSNSLFRMAYGDDGAISCIEDRVSATATTTKIVKTLVTQYYPGFGGNLILGFTGHPDDTTFYTGGGGNPLDYPIMHSGANNLELVAHVTNSPTVPLVFPSTGGLPSYDNALAAADSCTQQLFKPVPGNNGGPGPITTYTGSYNSESSSGSHDVDAIDKYSGRHYAMGQDDASTATSTGGGDIPATGPGYKGQVTGFTYDSSLTLFGQTVRGNVAALPGDKGTFDEEQQSIGQVVFLPFPPGNSTTGYAQFLQGATASGETCTTITPYKSYGAATRTGNELKGWMHVSDPNLVLQGFLIGSKPYIYLKQIGGQARDVTAQLATALACQPTDIASCYFDIQLDAIKLLSGVK